MFEIKRSKVENYTNNLQNIQEYKNNQISCGLYWAIAKVCI